MDTTKRDALVNMVQALTKVFKKYSRATRTKAWDQLVSKEGQLQMKKFLQDPNRPINVFQNKNWAGFKEWMEERNQ